MHSIHSQLTSRTKSFKDALENTAIFHSNVACGAHHSREKMKHSGIVVNTIKCRR